MLKNLGGKAVCLQCRALQRSLAVTQLALHSHHSRYSQLHQVNRGFGFRCCWRSPIRQGSAASHPGIKLLIRRDIFHSAILQNHKNIFTWLNDNFINFEFYRHFRKYITNVAPCCIMLILPIHLMHGLSIHTSIHT